MKPLLIILVLLFLGTLARNIFTILLLLFLGAATIFYWMYESKNLRPLIWQTRTVQKNTIH